MRFPRGGRWWRRCRIDRLGEAFTERRGGVPNDGIGRRGEVEHGEHVNGQRDPGRNDMERRRRDRLLGGKKGVAAPLVALYAVVVFTASPEGSRGRARWS